jgi:CubicO group peptidase (beta-lactamase class C family)
MNIENQKQVKSGRTVLAYFSGVILAVFVLLGCGCCTWDLDLVEYAPLSGDDWEVSTPEVEGLDPTLVAQLYFNAAKVETLEALLVIKNGRLIAEGYFNDGGLDKKTRIASVTKSFTSALVGIAIEQGYLTSIDQKMMEFFPELADLTTDPRKEQITIRQMMQMRAGYPWEESASELTAMMLDGFRTRYLADVPLIRDPGSGFDYSNLTSHLLGVVVARACGTDLKTFAEANLCAPMGADLGDWTTDWEYNHNGHADIHLTARDMAKFGLMYLRDGEYQGRQIVPAQWVRDSLQTYTENAWKIRIGRNYTEMAYGYQWWSARAGDHRFSLAWGHGGQQVALLPQLDMVIVVKANPLWKQHGAGPWRKEKANLNLVGNFIASLPSQ